MKLRIVILVARNGYREVAGMETKMELLNLDLTESVRYSKFIQAAEDLEPVRVTVKSVRMLFENSIVCQCTFVCDHWLCRVTGRVPLGGVCGGCVPGGACPKGATVNNAQCFTACVWRGHGHES